MQRLLLQLQVSCSDARPPCIAFPCLPDSSPKQNCPPSSLDVFVQQWTCLGLLTCTAGAAVLSH